MLGGLIQPALLIGHIAGEKMPLGVLTGCRTKQLFRLSQIPQVDGLPHLGVQRIAAGILLMSILLLLIPLLLVAAVLALPTAAGARSMASRTKS